MTEETAKTEKKARLYRVKVLKNWVPTEPFEYVEQFTSHYPGVGSEMGGPRIWKGSTVRVTKADADFALQHKIAERADAFTAD